jgi:hypothetical protein
MIAVERKLSYFILISLFYQAKFNFDYNVMTKYSLL